MMQHIVQHLSDKGYEVAGLNLEQPIVSDDESSGQLFDQTEFQNTFLDIGGTSPGGDNVKATIGPSLYTPLWLST